MGWTMLYLFVALKIPICAAIWLVWWAIKQEPDPSEDVRDDGGAAQAAAPGPAAPAHAAPRPARRARAGLAAARPPVQRARPRPRALARAAPPRRTTITSTPRMLVATIACHWPRQNSGFARSRV